VKCTVCGSFWLTTAFSKWRPIKWRNFRLTFGHLRSRDVISCLVTASSCKLQLCRKRSVQYTQVSAFYRHFKVTSGQMTSLLVTWDYVTSFPVTWQFPPASYSLVGSEMYNVREFLAFYSHFLVTSGQMTSLPGHFCHLRSRAVNFCQVTASHAIYSLVGNEVYSIREFLAFYSHFVVTSVQWRQFWVTFGRLRSRDVLSSHVTASFCKQPPCRKWNAEYISFCPSTAISWWLLAKSRHFLDTSGHMRPCDVISCHVTASSFEL